MAPQTEQKKTLRERLFAKKPRITKYSDEELRDRLSETEYQVLQLGKTESPYTGRYRELDQAGVYRCRVCNAELFSSGDKFDPYGAWPAFRAPVTSDAVGEESDWKFGVPRTESVCGDCGAHLGHVFPDGPGGESTRYCINSASLRFEATPPTPTSA